MGLRFGLTDMMVLAWDLVGWVGGLLVGWLQKGLTCEI